MPIRRAGLYGGLLGGAGDTLQLLAATRIKRREREQDQAEQRAWEMQKLQMNALAGISEKIAADPTKAKALIQAASSNPFLANLRPVIEGMRPSDPTIAAELQRQIGNVKSAADLPDVSRVAAAAGINTTQMPPTMPSSEPLDVRPSEMPAPPPQVGLTREMGQAPYAPPITPNIAPAETLLPELKARFAHNNPVIEDLQRGVTEQGTQIRQGQEDKLALDARAKRAEAYATKAGTDEATNENAWQATENELQNLQVLGPEKAKQAGEVQSATTNAEIEAKTTPDHIAALARATYADTMAKNQANLANRKAMIAAGIPDQETASVANQMLTRYQNDSKDFNDKQLAYRTLISSAVPELTKADKDMSPAAGLTLIFTYMKLVDPTSSVQKTEAGYVLTAQNLPQQMVTRFNAMFGSGSPVAKQQIADFVQQAWLQYGGSAKQQQRVNDFYSKYASESGIDPSHIVLSLDPALQEDPIKGLGVKPATVGDQPVVTSSGKRHDINGNPIP
jgi:hypothetical protein